MSISEKLLDAVEILTTDIVKKAQYDKTIEAQIISCEDESTGKYRCRYQDAIIYAYSNNIDAVYTKNSYVYILVPNGDMKKEKTILGATNKLGVNYISQAQGDQAYNIIGNNCIAFDGTFYLNTINKNYKYILYKYNTANEINLNTVALSEYLKQSSSLIVGATFRTSIESKRQYHGSYGIIYNLRFLDNSSNKEVIRSYVVNEDNMVDNPYRLLYPTRQYQIFDIDGANFIRVESIEIFNKDFFNATGSVTNTKLTSGDIEITNLEISGANRMLENEVNGLCISFFTPQGTFFTNGDLSNSYRTITAQVKIKGKVVAANQDNVSFYWGLENAGITTKSEYYNKYLEKGWKCINEKNIFNDDDDEQTQDTEPRIEWVPGSATYIVKISDATAYQNKIKVAAVYNDTVITKTIVIKNLASTIPVLTIESNAGTQFYYDVGHPTLTCKINNVEQPNYTYYWAYESDAGIFSELPETTEENTEYNTAVTALTTLQNAIADGSAFPNAEAQNLVNLEAAVKAFDSIQRVDKNKVYNVQVNNITNFGTFKCSVYNNNDIYLGTVSITLTNSFENQDIYTLVINNGSMVFQYNQNGIAPTSSTLETPQILQPLSFTIYDNLGHPVEDAIIENTYNCQSRWEFPVRNTMLQTRAQNDPHVNTEDGNYIYYDNKTSITYGIRSKYDIKKQVNQIKLTVEYKGIHLTAQTDFTFAKQGEPGTNGTQYLLKLVPNTRMSNPPLYPMITRIGEMQQSGSDTYILNYGLNSTNQETSISLNNGYQFFMAELWRNGELIWKGFSSSDLGQDGLSRPTSVTWSILKNNYGQQIGEDDSLFEIKNANNGSIGCIKGLEMGDSDLANIIKCSIIWQDKTYYTTIPFITAWTLTNEYKVKLADYSGFRYVIYTSDGSIPQYDNSHPFEFICEEKIDNIWENISYISDPTNEHNVFFQLATSGSIKTSSGVYHNCDLLQQLDSEFYRQGLQNNQFWLKPVSNYNGECISAAVLCYFFRKNGNLEIDLGEIYVPIHFLLNKYGLSNLNGWDGNKVEISNDGGYILAPQMGAGKKENDNSFTGVIMGEVKEANKTFSNTGLFGYSSGTQSFFLNSENGSAIFGKRGSENNPGGQIIIDPQNNDALLYSSNFWRNYNQETQLPLSYGIANEKGQGMLIDLSQPMIKFGNGNFQVDSDGILTAKEANIDGSITARNLTILPNATVTGLNPYIDARIPSLPNNILYRGDISIEEETVDNITTTTFKYKNTAGTPVEVQTITNSDGKYVLFEVQKGVLPPNGATSRDNETGILISSEGLLKAANALIYGTIYAQDGIFNGTIYAGNGLIGGWNITGNTIEKHYIEDGKDYWIALWSGLGENNRAISVSSMSVDSPSTLQDKFVLTYEGKLTAVDANLKGGSIANFHINGNTLYSGSHSSWNHDSDGIFLSSSASNPGDPLLSLGNGGKFYVTKEGVPHCNGSRLEISTKSANSASSDFAALDFFFYDTQTENETQMGQISCDDTSFNISTHHNLYIKSFDSNKSIYLESQEQINCNNTFFINNSSKAILHTRNDIYNLAFGCNDDGCGIFVYDINGGQSRTDFGKWLLQLNSNGNIRMPQINAIQPDSSAPNLFINNQGVILKSSGSSRRYKHDIVPLDNAKDILKIPVVKFKYNDGYISKDDWRNGLDIPGFIAEDVAQYYHIAAQFENDQVENWNIRHIVPPMLAVEQQHEKQIQQLRKQIDDLKSILQKILLER